MIVKVKMKLNHKHLNQIVKHRKQWKHIIQKI